jgi:hypothetical protein
MLGWVVGGFWNVVKFIRIIPVVNADWNRF